MAAALAGRTIVVPETRELDLFAGILERQGATTIRCPLVAIRDVADPAPVDAWLRRLAEGRFDDLVLFTGEGVTRLIGFAERAGIEAEVIEGFRRARKIVRGPKPTRALRNIGLAPDLSAEQPTTDGLIATLSGLDLEARRVGVQSYPASPPTLLEFLAGAGAEADPVLCYEYASKEEDQRVAAIIDALATGKVDLIAFTSTPQVRRLQEVARDSGLEDQLRRGLENTRIAAVGPVTAEAVEKAGGRASIVPETSFHLKPFVAGIAAAFEGTPR
jgi:uroporphyrinogen-III synthase